MPAFENANTEDEGEEQFVLLEERPTDVAVDAVGEVSVENLTTLRQIVTLLAHHYRLATVPSIVDSIQLQLAVWRTGSVIGCINQGR